MEIKKMKLPKRLFSLLLILFLCIENFAAIVSNNDGSAFITKAEFDSLKNDFQSQIDQYNTSIDNKIDGAIAAYLAGIQIVKQQELRSLINDLNVGFVSSDSLDFPTTKKGSYQRYFINIGVCKSRQDTANTMCQLQYVTGAIDNPQWKTIGDGEQGIFYLGSTTSSGNFKVEQYIVSEPFASVTGVVTSGGIRITGTDFAIPDVTFENSDPDAFLCSDDTWAPTVGVVHNVNVAKSFGVKDTYFTPILNLITGAQINENEEYFVKTLEINKPSTRDYSSVAADRCGYEIQASGKGWTLKSDRNTKLKVYNHESTAMQKTKIIQDSISGLMNEDIFYYNGCPIFTTNDQAGKVKMKLKFENIGNKQTVFLIKESKFDNTTISETGAITDVSKYKLTDTVKVDADAEITLEFDVKKNTTYWIKARPLYYPGGTITDLSYPTHITTNGIQFTESQ